MRARRTWGKQKKSAPYFGCHCPRLHDKEVGVSHEEGGELLLIHARSACIRLLLGPLRLRRTRTLLVMPFATGATQRPVVGCVVESGGCSEHPPPPSPDGPLAGAIQDHPDGTEPVIGALQTHPQDRPILDRYRPILPQSRPPLARTGHQGRRLDSIPQHESETSLFARWGFQEGPRTIECWVVPWVLMAGLL